MKTTLITLLIALTCTINVIAQDADKAKLFFKQSKDAAQAFYQSVLDESDKTFSFIRAEESKHNCNFVFLDESTRGTNEPLFVYFRSNKYNIGNKDLEIESVDIYTLSIAHGRFLDFAKWWIKYINPNETLETLSKQRTSKFSFTDDEGTPQTIQLIKTFDDWIIRGY